MDVGGAAVGTGLGIIGANDNNRAVKRQMNAQRDAAGQELELQGRVTEAQKERIRRDNARIQGLIAVSAAERGVGSGGTTEAQRLSADSDAGFNRTTIDTNRYAAGQRTLAQLRSATESLKSQMVNPFLAGLQGGMQGLSTGISIENAMNGPPTPTAPRKALDIDAFFEDP